MPKVETKTIKVDISQVNQKLISFLKQQTQGKIPYSALMRMIRKGEVRVNSKRSSPFYRLQINDLVRIPPFYIQESPTQKPNLNLKVIFEDNHILVIDKPASLAIHKGSKTSFSLTDFLLEHFSGKSFVPTPIHRLDKDTSGLLLLAKDFSTLVTYQKNWQNIEKKYLAWVKGKWTKERILDDYLLKTKNKIIFSKQGKRAISQVKPIFFYPEQNLTLLIIKIFTGRTRQIRVQLGLRGYPLLGDKKFKETSTSFLALHAYYLKLEHQTLLSFPNWPQPYFNLKLKELIKTL